MDASQLIDNQISSFDDWRGKLLSQFRQIINAADPEIKEEWKWNTAVWTHHGLVCAIAGFKNHVKINFFRGSELQDTHGLFNAGLDAKTMRSIDFYEGDKVDEAKLTDLVCEAITNNQVKS